MMRLHGTPVATCPRCHNAGFLITETYVVCAGCGEKYPFIFMDDAKILCETKANDIVRLVEED